MSELKYIVLPWQDLGRLCIGRIEGDEVEGVWFSDIKFEPCTFRWQVSSWTVSRYNTVYPTTDEVERFLMAAAMGVYYPIPEWGLTEEKICLLSQR